jgi:hypothetical protein
MLDYMLTHKIVVLLLLVSLGNLEKTSAQPGTKMIPATTKNQPQNEKPINGAPTAQSVEELPKFSGKISEIKTKGKVITLVVNVDGKPQEVTMTSKIKFSNETPGDLTALKEDVYVETKVNQPTQRSLIALEVKVYSGIKGKPPTGQITPAPAEFGESKNNLLISGKVSSFSEKSAFEGYRDLNIQAGPKTATIQIPQKGFNIQLVDIDYTKLKVGDNVELQGNMLKNGKLFVVAVKGMTKK